MAINFKRRCPICKSNLEVGILYGSEHAWYHCRNNCYSHTRLFSVKTQCYIDEYNVFDTCVVIAHRNSKEEVRRLKNKVERQIKYWKENDRYLMRFVTGDSNV